MPLNSGSPIIGRLASAGLGFLSSTWGFPVAGLMGSFSQITTPQMPPLHLLTRTLASPACVSQIPLTSPPACAPAEATPTVTSAAATRPQAINFKGENLDMNREAAGWGAVNGKTSESLPKCQTQLATQRICAMAGRIWAGQI